MLTITHSTLLSLSPCQPRYNAAMTALGRIPADDESISVAAALDAGIPLADLLWVVARIDRPILLAFAADCASVAVDDWERGLALRSPNERGADATFAAARACIAAARGGDLEEIRRTRQAAAVAWRAASADAADAASAVWRASASWRAASADAADAASAVWRASASWSAAYASAAAAAYAAADAADAADADANNVGVGGRQKAREERQAWCLARLREYLVGERVP